MTEQRPLRVFISYSHDTIAHQERVLYLADRLRADGIDAEIDQYNDSPSEGWPRWCERQIEAADVVLMVCTETYHRRISGDEEQGKGLGIVWEAQIIRQLLYDVGAVSDKFVPVLFSDASPEQIPTPIKGWTRYVVDTENGYEGLYRRLTKQPRQIKPTIGPTRSLPPRPPRQEAKQEAKQTRSSRPHPLRLFVIYSHRDENLIDELKSHLAPLRRSGVISEWTGRCIETSTDWRQNVSAELEKAELILLFVSANVVASEYAYEIEIRRAIEKHEQGLVRVVPIVLRPVHWRDTPFSVFQALPSNGRPISTWRDRDEAWVDVVKGITLICEEIKTATLPWRASSASPPREILPLYEVFKASGIPTVTFVAPEAFTLLKLSLAQPGRGVVIQGPSGIGKTTALRKALDDVQADYGLQPVRLLSARKSDEAKLLENIESWHTGVAAIDDFHRLDRSTQICVADYLKYLADRELPDKKLVIVGIPHTGQVLVDLAFDLATRIDVYALGKVTDETVIRMIEIGERALNVEFLRKTEIARAASGSLNIAQLLCFHLAAAAGVQRTQVEKRRIDPNVTAAVANVLNNISMKFGTMVRTFSSFGNKADVTCIEILRELARTDDGVLLLSGLRDARPDLRNGIDRFIKHDYMGLLYDKHPESKKHILFEKAVPALIIDDPQLTFYLIQTPQSVLLKASGKRYGSARSRVFISYSHADSEWLERLRIHLRPLERDGAIDLWDDTKIRAGTVWRDDIAKAIDLARVAVLVITADFLASDFIADNELPPLLEAAGKDGLVVLPIIVSASRFNHVENLAKFQAVNPPSKPLIEMTRAEQEELLAKVSEVIEDAMGIA